MNNMNEFTGKKLGEVLAFCEVGEETFKMGVEALTEKLGAEFVTDYIERSNMYFESVKKFANDGGVGEVATMKLEATGTKLRAMRDLYVGDQWHNPTELLEWSGFFEGAAIVHFALVRGVAMELDNSDLLNLVNEAIDFHYQILEHAESELESVGQDRATK